MKLPWLLALACLAAVAMTPAHAAATPPLMVAFGDSITWGANASDNTTNNYQSILPLSDHLPGPGDNTYPGDLGRALQRTVYDYGYPGQTTQTDLPRLKNVLSQIQPKTILLMEGTNDIIGGRSMSDALSGLQTEVNTIIAANVTVVLLTTTPTCYPADNQYYPRNDLIQQYDAGVRQIATSSRVRLVDVDQAFQQSGECAQLTVRRDGSNDYLHPNDTGNTLISQTVASVVNLVVGIDHSAGVPGSTATITGSNVEPQEPVNAVWDCPTVTCTGGSVLGIGTADAKGNVAIPITIPASATPGAQHTIGVQAQDTGAFGTLGFSLPQVTVATDHSSGPPGSAATITGSNYGANETVTAYFDCSAAPCTGKTAIGAASTAADGSLSLPVVIPSTAASGTTYSIGVLGGSSSGFGTVTYTVNSAPTAATVTRLSIHRSGAMLVLSWQLARPAAVIGFNLYGGALRLNARMIAIHAGHRYHFVTGRSGASRYLLDVLLESGKRVGVRFPAVR